MNGTYDHGPQVIAENGRDTYVRGLYASGIRGVRLLRGGESSSTAPLYSGAQQRVCKFGVFQLCDGVPLCWRPSPVPLQEGARGRLIVHAQAVGAYQSFQNRFGIHDFAQ